MGDFLSQINSLVSKDWWDDWYNYKHIKRKLPVKRLKLRKFFMHPCIRQRTLFTVTCSRGKPCLVGPSLCHSRLLPSNKNLSLRSFRGGSVCIQAIRPKRKVKGGCISWLSFLLEQLLSAETNSNWKKAKKKCRCNWKLDKLNFHWVTDEFYWLSRTQNTACCTTGVGVLKATSRTHHFAHN